MNSLRIISGNIMIYVGFRYRDGPEHSFLVWNRWLFWFCLGVWVIVWVGYRYRDGPEHSFWCGTGCCWVVVWVFGLGTGCLGYCLGWVPVPGLGMGSVATLQILCSYTVAVGYMCSYIRLH